MIRVFLRCLIGWCLVVPPAGAADEPIHLSAYYYPWYDGDGRHWKKGYYGKNSGLAPALGEYSSRDSDTIFQHAQWSRQMGIKNWVSAWWGQQSWEDFTIKYRVAPVLDQLKDPDSDGRPVTFCLLYESAGLLGLDPQDGIKFDSRNAQKFLSDFEYLANTYFSHPSYYKINGRPVVYLYLSRTFSGDFKGAIEQVRSAAKVKQINLYLVGDEVYWGEPNPARIALFDAITSYNMHGPEPTFDQPGDWSRFIDECDAVYRRYHAAAGAVGVSFIPGVLPGFNSQGAGSKHYVIPRGFPVAEGEKKTTLDLFLNIAQRNLDKKLRAVTITSFNEWHEGTQLEPSKERQVVPNELWDFSIGRWKP